MPNNSAKYGLKLFLLCDYLTKYILPAMPILDDTLDWGQINVSIDEKLLFYRKNFGLLDKSTQTLSIKL